MIYQDSSISIPKSFLYYYNLINLHPYYILKCLVTLEKTKQIIVKPLKDLIKTLISNIYLSSILQESDPLTNIAKE